MQKIADGLSDHYKTIATLGSGSGVTGGDIQEVVKVCQDLLREYKTVIEKCKAKKQHSIRASIGATIRTAFSKSEMERLQRALDAHGAVLRTALISSTRTQLQSVMDDVEEAKLHRVNISRHLVKLQDKCNSIEGLLQTLQEGQKVSFAALQDMEIQTVKKALSNGYSGIYGNLNPRYDELSEASPRKFECSFDDSSRLLNLSRGLGISWVDWLQKGNGVFHFS
ncbi:hypothetical protein V8F20_003914 [Naviculisporaceae sp. PSN 640]